VPLVSRRPAVTPEMAEERKRFYRWRNAAKNPNRPFEFLHWSEQDWLAHGNEPTALGTFKAPPPERRCGRCFTLYPPHLIDVAFRTGGGEMHRSTRRRLVCRPCEQTSRDEHKQSDRWAVKARDVIRRHAVSLKVTKEDLIQVYGWDPRRLAHDAEHQYGNGCSYCGHPYMAMGHGLADITLDVQDPEARPYYRTNTKWCCATCNRKKGRTPPEQFERDRQVYELWTARQGAAYDPLTDDPASIFFVERGARASSP